MWERILSSSNISATTPWAQATKRQVQALLQELTKNRALYTVQERIQQKEQVNTKLVRSNGLPKVVTSEFVSVVVLHAMKLIGIQWNQTKSQDFSLQVNALITTVLQVDLTFKALGLPVGLLA